VAADNNAKKVNGGDKTAAEFLVSNGVHVKDMNGLAGPGSMPIDKKAAFEVDGRRTLPSQITGREPRYQKDRRAGRASRATRQRRSQG
jgi:hypothetical protein